MTELAPEPTPRRAVTRDQVAADLAAKFGTEVDFDLGTESPLVHVPDARMIWTSNVVAEAGFNAVFLSSASGKTTFRIDRRLTESQERATLRATRQRLPRSTS